MALGQPPKKQTSRTKTGMRRSHFVRKLARVVNARSSVKVQTKSRRVKKAK